MKQLTLILLSSLAVVCCINSQQHLNQIATQQHLNQITTQENEVLPVTAGELIRAYIDSKVEANKKYKGKLLEINGSILEVDTGLADDIIVQLGAKKSLLNILVRVKKISSLTSINQAKGQKITVICKGAGESAGWPVLNSCTFK